MPLAAGKRLGPYEILAPLGAGGMGEVYRARDTRLDRTVAVKVLPTHLSSSPEIRQRFEREARTVSQLAHPHICALYDVGHQDATAYLVMEYLEGDTLADRLSARGALPLELALRYGIEIANALDAAHRHGIVHRDLKPGNVMLTPSGVKVLDFGLAKALAPTSSASALTALPDEKPLTATGTLLGTVHYMAPEQLEGREADARTDIFALGLVLYQMVTGKRAFGGATQASLIGAILRDEPTPVSRVQPLAPRSLDRLVSTCLAKEPDERWQTARDVALQLEGIRQERSAAEPVSAGVPARRRRAAMPWALTAAAVALAIFAWTVGSRQGADAPRTLTSFLPPPPGTTFHVYGANPGAFALSPDGRRLAFGARNADGSSRLWVRDLAALEAYPVPGGEDPLYVFWSPDSRSLGFFAKGRLKVVEASPSPPPPRELAEVIEARGGSWGPDGTILYAPNSASPLLRVPATGGTPRPATDLDEAAREVSHRWPHFLPDGRRFLYEVRQAGPDPNAPLRGPHAILVRSLDGHEKRPILSEHTNAVYVAPGYLLFRRGNSLMAAPCDPRSLALEGEPRILAPGIEGFAATGFALFSVAADLLVYSPLVETPESRMVWLDRSGRELATVGSPGDIGHLALSPDGRSAVASQLQEPSPPELWQFDTGVGRGVRLTRDDTPQLIPVFSADGRRLFFSSFSGGPWDLWEMTLPGGDAAKVILQSPSSKTPNDVSPDGRHLVYREFNDRTRGYLMVLPLVEERRPWIFLATADDESNADFSPDGRWVAYVSDESGRQEVYAASFPEPTRRVRVSSEGGIQPRWSRDGKELFYVRSGRLMAVAVERQGEEPGFGESRSLFSLPLYSLVDPGFHAATRYDVAPDGRFLALLRAGEETPTPLVLVQNWAEVLEKK